MPFLNELWNKLRGKKKKDIGSISEPVKEEPSLLKRLCGDDTVLYRDMYDGFIHDPRESSSSSYEEASKKAKEAVRKGLPNSLLYKVAGNLALYEKNVEGIIIGFSKAGYERIAEIPEKAIEIAHKHYTDPIVGLKIREGKNKGIS